MIKDLGRTFMYREGLARYLVKPDNWHKITPLRNRLIDAIKVFVGKASAVRWDYSGNMSRDHSEDRTVGEENRKVVPQSLNGEPT